MGVGFIVKVAFASRKNYGMTGKDHDATLFPSVYSGCCSFVSMRSQEVLALTEAIL